jgi:hypothetical protein
MEPFRVFVTQLLWFLCVWSAVVYLVVWPWSLRLGIAQRLSLWVAPQMFRVLGLGLLVPNLSPGISQEFAVATALGDSVTATLALLAFVGLRRGWRRGRALAWACSVVGIADLLVAFPHAAATSAMGHLAAQWYVPVFAGPIMVVSHAACLVTLLGSRWGKVEA